MRASLELADLAADDFAPPSADLLADQALQDAVDLDAGRIGRRHQRGLRFADDHVVIDGQAQANVVHGFAGWNIAAELVTPREWLAIHEPRLDLPQAIVAQITVAVDGAAMHQAARTRLGRGVHNCHRNSPVRGALRPYQAVRRSDVNCVADRSVTRSGRPFC